jgi:hypothetical protein
MRMETKATAFPSLYINNTTTHFLYGIMIFIQLNVRTVFHRSKHAMYFISIFVFLPSLYCWYTYILIYVMYNFNA